MTNVNEVLDNIITGKTFTIYEPCDCGDRVMHNNGGNYHEVVSYKIDNGEWLARYDDTCELTPPEEWRKVEAEVVAAEVAVMLSNGWEM